MNALRHPPLAFWTFLVLVLGGVLGWAHSAGGDTPVARPSTAASDPATAVMSVRMRGGQLVSLANPPTEQLRVWAIDTAGLAEGYANQRDRAGISPNDNLTQAFHSVAEASLALAQVPLTDRTALDRAVEVIHTRMDNLVAVQAGLAPLPELNPGAPVLAEDPRVEGGLTVPSLPPVVAPGHSLVPANPDTALVAEAPAGSAAKPRVSTAP